jgi:hypothetical protein
LRFTPADTARIVACPQCGRPPQPIAGAAGLVGFRLFVLEGVARDLPEAVAVAIPVPEPRSGR